MAVKPTSVLVSPKAGPLDGSDCVARPRYELDDRAAIEKRDCIIGIEHAHRVACAETRGGAVDQVDVVAIHRRHRRSKGEAVVYRAVELVENDRI